MGYIEETQNNAVGREIICPHCEMKNDRDRDTCWSCGISLLPKSRSVQTRKKFVTPVDMPLSYYVLTVLASLNIAGGIFLLPFVFWPPFLIFWVPLMGVGLLLFAVLGIWRAVERSAEYLRQIVDDASK